jgi:hypothetical protein
LVPEAEIETKHDAVRVMRPNDLEEPASEDDEETEVSAIPTPETLAPELAPGGALGELNLAELDTRERKATGVPPSGELEPEAPETGEADELFDAVPETGEADELFVEDDHTFDESAPATGDLPVAPAKDAEQRDQRWLEPASPYLKTLQGVGEDGQPSAAYDEADATEGERPPEPTRPYGTPDRPAPAEAPMEAVVVVSPESLDEPPEAAVAPQEVNPEVDNDKSQIATSVFEVSNPGALDMGGGYVEPDVTSPYGPGESALATKEAVQPQSQITPQPDAATRIADLDPGVIEQLAKLRPDVLTELGPDGIATLTPEKLSELLDAPLKPPETLNPEPIATSDPAEPAQGAKEPPTPSPLAGGSSEPVLAPQPALGRMKLAKMTPAARSKPRRGTVGLPEELAKTSRMAVSSAATEPSNDDDYASIEVVADDEG